MLSVFSRNDGPGPGLLRTTEGPAGQRTTGDVEGILKSSHVRKNVFLQPLSFRQTFFKGFRTNTKLIERLICLKDRPPAHQSSLSNSLH